MNENIDVFGGTGFIGSRFCEMYNNESYIHPREDNIPISNDILYLISTTDNYSVFTDLHVDINTNLNKLMSVLENCKNKDVIFTFISSWFVYGKIDFLPFKEEYICNPKGFYSITKKCAEDLLISFCETFNIKYRILRLSNVYGKGDVKRSNKKNALQHLIDQIKQNEDINLYHNGNFIRDYMHVDDVCRAIKLCIDTGPINEIINIGSGNQYIFKDLIDFVMKETKSISKINQVDSSAFHKKIQTKNACLDITKLSSLGFKSQIDIYEGIKSLL